MYPTQTTYLKSALPNYACWSRAKNYIEIFHAACTSERIHSTRGDMKQEQILSEKLLLSTSSIPASPGLRTFLTHLTSSVTQASLPTELSPNLTSMRSITRRSESRQLRTLCPAHLPRHLRFCFRWLVSKLFWQMSHYPPARVSASRKKKPCATSIRPRENNTAVKTATAGILHIGKGNF